MNGYMTVQETAEKWGVTSRQVQILCKDNRISGATKLSRIWIIPDTAEKPTIDVIHEVDDAKRKVNLSGAPGRMHEFFAGSGLVAYGLKGLFSPVWSNDISERKAAVYNANFLGEHFSLGDIKDVSGGSLPAAHLSWASFPCQDLSLAGNQKGIFAERSGLVWEWLRVFDELKEKPRIIALENVAGLLSSNDGENYRNLHNALIQRSYKCGAICLNASVFVPQSRPRVFVIAVKKEIAIPASIAGDEPCWLHNSAAIKLGRELEDWVWWTAKKPPKRSSTISDILDPNAVYDKDDVLRLVPDKGMKKLNGNDRIVATGYRRTRNGSQQLELRFDGVAGCLRTPGGGSSKQYVVVRENGQNHARLLTVREAARLMGAPDSFMLPGTYNDGYYAMGDAVALPVAKYIGKNILLPLVEAAYHE
ncbi:MAG: DNA (cytosine-5-)-methyltransferase [Schwartzia sp.]|nr:DNA (cytosine-5-)-methyltransferase [Schwartzia sp. (in: firmicutes)]